MDHYPSVVRHTVVAALVLLAAASIVGGLVLEEWAATRYAVLYLAPFWAALACWAWLRLERSIGSGRRTPQILEAAVLAVAALRMLTDAIPISGHMLFLAYSGVSQKATWYRMVAALVASITTYFKLVVWEDPTSWFLGIVAGSIAGAAQVRLADNRSGHHRVSR